MKKNIIFLHIPKNGGSTLHKVLNRNYSKKNIYSIENQDCVDKLYALSFEKYKKIKLLKGHLTFGVHQLLIGESEYITMVRNPEDRILSFYNYVLNNKQNRLHRIVSDKKMSFYEFVEQINQPDVCNGQIRQISGINDREDLMLEKALENIEKYFSFVGTLEKYDESILLLSKMYNWKFPYFKVENKTIGATKHKIDSETSKLVRELNNGDMRLYEQVDSRLSLLIRDNITSSEINRLRRNNAVYSNGYDFLKQIKNKIVR